MSISKLGILSIALLLLFSPNVMAQQVSDPFQESINTVFLDSLSGYSPLGLHSARTLGMGGAGIGIADDASALRYNPSGLGNIDRWQIFGSGWYDTSRGFQKDTRHNEWDDFGFSQGGVVAPITEGLTAAFLYQVMQFYEAQYRGVDRWGDYRLDLDQEGQLNSYNIGLGWRMMDDINIGLSLSYLNGNRDQSLYSEGWALLNQPGEFNLQGQVDRDIEGFGLTMGAQFFPGPENLISAGVTLISFFDVEEESNFHNAFYNPGNIAENSYKSTTDVDIPFTLGGGVAWRPYENEEGYRPLTLGLDVIYSLWDSGDYPDDILVIFGDTKYDYSLDVMIGGEYQYFITDSISLTPRIGYKFEKLPNELETGETLYWHNVTGGLGVVFGVNLQFDVAYQRGWLYIQDKRFNEELERDRLVFSMTYAF